MAKSLKTTLLFDAMALVILIAWPMLYFWPVTLGQKVFAEGDINWLFLPIRTELARALSEGRLPLWSPGLQAGFPLFAEGEVAALYPLNLITYRLLPAGVANSLVILFNLAWASTGMYLLIRSSGMRIASALLAGFVFGFSGFMTAQISHIPHLTVAAWLPWLILLQSAYWRASGNRRTTFLWAILGAFAIALELLGGFPQIALINFGVYVLCGAFAPLIWTRSADISAKERLWLLVRHLPRTSGISLTSLLLGAGIAAVQLLPTLELVGLSIRGQDMGKSFFTSYSLQPSYLTQFISPFSQLGQPNAFNMEYWGYIGVLPFFLAFVAVLKRRDSRTIFFCLLALLALALALGGNNPAYDWLYYIPVFNRFRVPARFLFLFTFAAAFLAATGLEDLLSDANDTRPMTWPVRVARMLTIVIGLGTIYFAYDQPSEWWTETWRRLPIVLISASIGIILLARVGLAHRNLLATAAFGLIVLDLGSFAAPFLSNLASMAPLSDLVQVPRSVLAMDNVQTAYRVVVDKHPYTMAAIRASLWTNIPLTYNKQGIKSYLPSLALQRNEAYVSEMTLQMRNLINIRYYLLPLEMLPFGDPLPPPFDESEPYGGLTLSVLQGQPEISPTSTARLEVSSYTDESHELGNGTLAGEIVLRLDNGESKILPIRLGIETADWAYDGLASIENVNHDKPGTVLSFPAYLKSVGHTFEGHKYVARYDLAENAIVPIITAIGVRSFLPGSQLTIERMTLIDQDGRSVSLAALVHRNEMSLAFRSHTAAMWENRDVLPRAFVVHRAEKANDQDALARLKSPDFRPDQVVLLDDEPGADIPAALNPERPNDQVSITEYKPERVVLKTKIESAGYLVLTDSWYPGWVASVDGQPAPVYRADYIFRAVPLSPGEHSVVFEYRPVSLIWGAVVSLLSVLIAVIFSMLIAKQQFRPGIEMPSLHGECA